MRNDYFKGYKFFKASKLHNEADFESVFHEMYPVLCFYSIRITKNRSSSQDIAEESFIKAWQRRKTIQELKAYLYSVVRNASLDWLEAENRRRLAEEEAAKIAVSFEAPVFEGLIKAEMLRELYFGINKLPPQRQRVIKMLYQDGKTVKQVAAALKVSLAAVKQHKKEGIFFLRKILHILIIVCLFHNW